MPIGGGFSMFARKPARKSDAGESGGIESAPAQEPTMETGAAAPTTAAAAAAAASPTVDAFSSDGGFDDFGMSAVNDTFDFGGAESDPWMTGDDYDGATMTDTEDTTASTTKFINEGSAGITFPPRAAQAAMTQETPALAATTTTATTINNATTSSTNTSLKAAPASAIAPTGTTLPRPSLSPAPLAVLAAPPSSPPPPHATHQAKPSSSGFFFRHSNGADSFQSQRSKENPSQVRTITPTPAPTPTPLGAARKQQQPGLASAVSKTPRFQGHAPAVTPGVTPPPHHAATQKKVVFDIPLGNKTPFRTLPSNAMETENEHATRPSSRTINDMDIDMSAPSSFPTNRDTDAMDFEVPDSLNESSDDAAANQHHQQESFEDIYQAFTNDIRDCDDRGKTFAQDILSTSVLLGSAQAEMLLLQGEMIDFCDEMESTKERFDKMLAEFLTEESLA